MDLSKDKVNYDLLLAKLHAYGFTNITEVDTNRWQRRKVNTSSGSWSELLLGVP